jgi:proteasome lid subunit RPN8/RPN11
VVSGQPDPLAPGREDPETYYPGGEGRLHPGPAEVSLPVEMRDAIIDHSRREAPLEACGLIVGDRPAAAGGRAARWVPLRNASQSPYRYTIDPDDLLRLTIETDDADEVFWAIVHSHVGSPARPSPTDVRESHYPDSLYVLLSLDPNEADAVSGDPGIRAWRIVDGAVHEVAVTIEDRGG